MVQYRRNRVPGGTYFFTATLLDRRSRILTEHINLLRQAFRATRNVAPFQTVAAVVLPDHLHVIWALPDDDSNYAKRWKAIKSGFTRSLRERGVALVSDGNGGYRLWQSRYWEHTMRDDRDLQAHMDYIHFNPVKHGLVKRMADWPYSSFHRYVRQGWLPDDWAGDADAFMEGRFGE
jgi:putative transposase